MALIKDGKVVSDEWVLVDDQQAVPASGDVIVGLQRLLENAAELEIRSGKLGVRLDPEDEVGKLEDSLNRLELIAINFPKFADGRGYSKARLLRERFEYKRELRAVGDVLADQLYLMRRCGIDSFQLKDGKDAAKAIACLNDLSVAYQGASDEPLPIYRRMRA
jgi:uncharacterized protein (DUF934 family)